MQSEQFKKKEGYPKSAYFVVTHQILERFSFYAINVILPFYFQNILHFDEEASTAIYHGYSVFSYLSSIIGAVIADSLYGKYKTILLFSAVYSAGTFLTAFSATELVSSDLTLTITILGLLCVALAAGAIKPCITAFGGDQFKLPDQEKELNSFFPFLYIWINLSLLVAGLVTPILRRDVSCFGKESCYSLAFAVPFTFIVLSVLAFWIGRRDYRHIIVNENVVGKFLRCIRFAIVRKFTSSSGSDKVRKHWLDYAEVEYSAQFIGNVKAVLDVLVLFIPVIIFWAVYEQQFSTWAFQAERMNGVIGSYEVPPDQVATLNFILTFLFLPVFEQLIFPLLSKCNLLTKSMHRVVFGFICSTLAYVCCYVVELRIEASELKTIHVVWLLPQYTLMSVAEVMVVPPLNSFSYSQAPDSMKSVLLTATLLPQALGSVVVIAVAKGNIFQTQSVQFLFFAGLNTGAVILLIALLWRYKNPSINNDDLELKMEESSIDSSVSPNGN
ncbi:solute carrier family 15 member 1 [Folsomia candida]|uniref:solute carrier family 15 member 1 n=1 Tax=Folsomia candida TaxID=158441 RepID=UPI0016050D1F|nr:solute carrier family 15 member 1 [Folsomia candida]XP_035701210.1 solute carrier family 15 member 1 [Folsomia candida]